MKTCEICEVPLSEDEAKKSAEHNKDLAKWNMGDNFTCDNCDEQRYTDKLERDFEKFWSGENFNFTAPKWNL